MGGLVFISTHPAWPAHELPWDFWRYQPAAFQGLFHRATGFELLAVSAGLPCRASLVDDAPTRPIYRQTVNQGVVALARKAGTVREDLVRWDIDVREVVDTMYPLRDTAQTRISGCFQSGAYEAAPSKPHSNHRRRGRSRGPK